MRNWNTRATTASGGSYGTGGRLETPEHARDFIRDATQRPSFAAMPAEDSWVDTEAANRFTAEPTKSEDQHKSDIRREYGQYRQQVRQRLADEESLLQWRVDQGEFGGDMDVAREARWDEIRADAETERAFPRLKTAATPQEEQLFKQTAQDTTKIPTQDTQRALRIVTGAKEAAYHLAREKQEELARVGKHWQESKDELDKAIMPGVAPGHADYRTPDRLTELSDLLYGAHGLNTSRIPGLRTEVQDAQARYNALETRENSIKTALGIP